MKKRFAALLCFALLALLSLLALSAAADEGDYDKITDYLITVDLREDGSADITYDVDWQVLAGEKSEYLSWVKIGLANAYAEDLTPLTDTVAGLSLLDEGGVYAKVVFSRRYYSPAVAAENGGESRVRFAFTVHQSHLFTLNDDGTASFAFTPGWFDDLCVDRLAVRWKNGGGFLADNTGEEDGYLTWEFGPLAHGQAAMVHVTVPAATAAAFDSGHALTADMPSPALPDDGDLNRRMTAFLLLVGFVILLAVLLVSFTAGWGGGFGEDINPDDWFWYSNGIHTVRLLRSAPPPQGYHKVDPPKQFRAGGGSSRGGGVGRRGGGSDHHSGCACVSSCACACASSCACACACAGGGRAGCSVKELYRVKLPRRPDQPNA